MTSPGKPEPTKPKPNLYERLAEIAGSIHVDKNGRMTEAGKYNYIKHEDLIVALKAILKENGIVTLPVAAELLEATEYKTARGALGRHVRTRHTYRVVDAWDPTVWFDIQGLGEAADTQDKGTQKAGTSAEKYLYQRLLKVTEEVDSDGIAIEEGVVAEAAPRPAPGSQPIPQSNGYDANELGKLKAIAATLSTPWAEPVLKARLERFGFDVVKADLFKAGATATGEAIPPPPPTAIPPPPPPAPVDMNDAPKVAA